MIRILLVLSVFSCGTATHAAKLSCYEDPVTSAMQCINPAAVRQSAESIRYAKLYTGGPNSVRETAFTIHTNCGTGVTHLKDRDGVSFAGGDGNETKALRSLRGWMCSAALAGKPKKQ